MINPWSLGQLPVAILWNSSCINNIAEYSLSTILHNTLSPHLSLILGSVRKCPHHQCCILYHSLSNNFNSDSILSVLSSTQSHPVLTQLLPLFWFPSCDGCPAVFLVSIFYLVSDLHQYFQFPHVSAMFLSVSVQTKDMLALTFCFLTHLYKSLPTSDLFKNHFLSSGPMGSAAQDNRGEWEAGKPFLAVVAPQCFPRWGTRSLGDRHALFLYEKLLSRNFAE